jgi:hypothetical protein
MTVINMIEKLEKNKLGRGINERIHSLAYATIESQRLSGINRETADLVSNTIKSLRGEPQAKIGGSKAEEGLKYLLNAGAPLKSIMDAMASGDRARCNIFYWALDAIGRAMVKEVFYLTKAAASDMEAMHISSTSVRQSTPELANTREPLFFSCPVSDMRDSMEAISTDILCTLRTLLMPFANGSAEVYRLARFWAADGSFTYTCCNTWQEVEAVLGVSDMHPEDKEASLVDDDGEFDDYM